MYSFVNRSVELDRLTSLYESNEPELAVVHGRRRLGKTALVEQSLEGRDDAVVYQARQKTRRLQIDQFVERAAATVPGIVVLDEFPYLVETAPALPSVLQALFDREFEDSSVTVVLVGSSISMMEEAALLGDSPLYGRASLKLDVDGLPFGDAMAFYDRSYDPDEQVRLWSIFGGTPYYLEEAAPAESIGAAVFEAILTRYGPLHDDPDYVIRMELADPARYFAVLESIAGGATTRNEIGQVAGIDRDQLSKYLHRLERLRLVEREVPVTERPERSRKGRYRHRDELFRFWFRFVYGSGTRYDDLGREAYTALVEPELADFASPVFEQLAGRALRTLYSELTITDVGRWWHGEHEVDVVGLTTGGILVAGECKFRRSPVGYDVLSQLEDHVDALQWTPPGGGEPDREYALFSRSGFKRSVREAAAERDDVRLFTVEDVVSALRAPER